MVTLSGAISQRNGSIDEPIWLASTSSMRVVSAGTLMTYQSMSPVVSIAADATSPSAAALAVAAVLFGSVSVILPVGDREMR